MKLPPELMHAVKPEPDPLGVFAALAQLPSITFNEYVAYEFLVKRFRRLREGLPIRQQRRLAVEFSSGGQLWIRWRGRPDDSRSMVLISHVDREGFLLSELRTKDGKATGWHVTGEELEEERYGLPVLVHSGNKTFKGRVIGKGRPARNQLGDTVALQLDSRGTRAPFSLRKSDQFVGVAELCIDPPFKMNSEGVISANSVDNAAGVSVTTTVIEGIARWNWPVNVDVFYTTCEEAGFCGVVNEILKSEVLANDWSFTWVVVDSSSQLGFIDEDIPRSLRHDAGVWSEDQAGDVNLQEVVIRTGDKFTRFDPGVSFLLHAAALNSQRMLAFHKEAARKRKRDAKRFGFCELEQKELAPFGSVLRSFRRAVRSGRMVGGWCEATPLVLSSALRGQVSVEELRLSPRVGSVAIPVSYYRNTFRGQLKPEKCHVAAVMRACTLLSEAIRLNHRWVFAEFPRGPLAGSIEPEERVRALLRWHQQYGELAATTRAWVCEHTGKDAYAE